MKLMIVSKISRMSAMRHHEGHRPEGRPHHMPGMNAMHGPVLHGDRKPPFPPKGMPPRPERMMSRERLLAIISEFPEGVNQKQLAERAHINASSTSEVVAKLEDDGYLVREIDPNDKRVTILKLTEMGQVRAEEVINERESYLDHLFSKLSEEEKQALSDILDKLIERPERPEKKNYCCGEGCE